MMKASVLITICDGTVDYCTNGEVQVVVVDFDRNMDTAFPDDVDSDLRHLKDLPKAMPWVASIVRRLRAQRLEICENIKEVPDGTSDATNAVHGRQPGAPG